MERESDENSAPRHGRDRNRVEEAAGLEDETLPLEDVGAAPGENPQLDDV